MTLSTPVFVDMASAAANMARVGWSVFPVHGILPTGGCTCGQPECKSPGKHPLQTGWKEMATKDPQRAYQMLQGPIPLNIGIRTGQPSGVIVLDVDGPTGLETLSQFQLPDTLTVRTGGGGQHRFHGHPAGQEIRNMVRFLPGLDIRADGGFVVAPPSLHASGRRYEWENALGVAPWEALSPLIHGGDNPFARAERARGRMQVPAQVPEGQRNDTLFRWACKLRAQGNEEESIRIELHNLNQQQCVPPLAPHEIEQIWHSVIERYPKGIVHSEQGHDEYGLVKRVQQVMESTTRSGSKFEIYPCVSTRGNIWGYSEGIYRPLNFEGLATIIEGWTGEHYVNAEGKPKTFRPRIGQTEAVWRHIKALNFFEEFFNEAPSVAGFSNCVLYPDGATAPHSPRHRLTTSRAYPWDPHAQCPGWLNFLGQTFAGCSDGLQRILALQEFFGAVIFHMATHYEKALLLVGDGANGKSVILDVLSAMVPPNGLICVPPHNMSQEYRAILLASAHLNVVTEMPAGELRDSEAFKAAVSGDSMEGREIREKPVRFRPRGAHALAANRMPEISDFSYGFQRRWIILETPNKVPIGYRTPKLGRKLLDHELFGIVAWGVDGAKRLILNNAYTTVMTSEESVKEWVEDSDQVAVFASEWLKKPGDTNAPRIILPTALESIYATYTNWTRDTNQGRGTLSRNKFSRRLVARGFERMRDTNTGGILFNCAVVAPVRPAMAAPTTPRLSNN